MKKENTRQGFTLIEILIVVLIIAILSAVALPQYQLAVEKSNYAKSQILSRTLAESQERYYLANGEYASNFDELDISLPGTYTLNPQKPTWRIYNWGRCNLDQESAYCKMNQGTSWLQIYYQHSDGHWVPPGSKLCLAQSLDLNNVGNKLCKAVTGKTNYKSQNKNSIYTEWVYPPER